MTQRVSKRGRVNEGKPPIAEYEPTKRLEIKIPESSKNHALSQPGGASEYIRRLIDQDIKQNEAPA